VTGTLPSLPDGTGQSVGDSPVGDVAADPAADQRPAAPGDGRATASSDAAADDQRRISAEIAELAAKPAAAQPLLDYPPYRSSLLRHPTKDLHHADPEGVELVAPVFGARDVADVEADLTIQHSGEPLGERIVVTGRIVDGEGRPVRHQLVEIWQANASGRYIHKRDQHPAPLDPNFTGTGRCITDSDGVYRFVTVKPGPYPWRNHLNAWRPAHIHFSLFGNAFTERLITQMYFPGDPLFPFDPIYQSVTDPSARDALIAAYDHDLTRPEISTGYRWDIVLSGSRRTWTEQQEDAR
jgi:protocatechuate 3,4-dioxygenase, beta subunit